MASPAPRRDARRRKPATTHEVQAAAEGASPPAAGRDTVEFLGERYAIADEVGSFPIWRFAYFADGGVDADSPMGMAAQYEMLRDCIAPDEWARFGRDATVKKAKGDQLLAVIEQVLEQLAARPTRPPNDSSPGRATTPGSSKGSSSTGASRSPELVSVDSLLDP